MKKLLALVLCVMLFVSVIPTAAFATAESTASGISLWPVVKQANHFYGAVQKYDGMRKTVGLYNGFAKAYPELIKSPLATGPLASLKELFETYRDAEFDDDTTGKVQTLPSGKELNYTLAQIWWGLGTAYVGEYVDTAHISKESHGVEGTLTYAIAGAEANIPAVTVPDAWKPAD